MEEREEALIRSLYPPRSCFNCKNLDEREPEDDEPGSGVASWCLIYMEWIDSEAHAARDCPVYDPASAPREVAS